MAEDTRHDPPVPATADTTDTILPDIESSLQAAITAANADITDMSTSGVDAMSLKRKTPSGDDDDSLSDASPQKRPKVADDGDDTNDDAALEQLMESALQSAVAAASDPSSTAVDTLMQDLTTASALESAIASTIPGSPQHISSMIPSQQSYQAPMPPPMIPAAQQLPMRENMQFTPSDLPKDDDGMMRWLAQRVRDSAAQNRDMIKEESEEAGAESDPETRAERERVRAENRERKKKWREENSDRNKDNDLRGRVSRRANKLFGPDNSEEKRAWMEKEFSKRKVKREFKSRLKTHDRQGSYTWNVNDDHTDDTPSQMMRDMLSRQEGAAENFRNWISTADIDNDTWNAALAEISGNPDMMKEVEALILADDAGTNVAGVGGAQGDGLGKLDDGLTSKFDAAYDAIVSQFTPRKQSQGLSQAQTSVDETAAETVTIDDATPAILEEQLDHAAAELADVPSNVETEKEINAIEALTEADLQRMIESGEMTMDEIEALEAALQGAEDEVEGAVAEGVEQSTDVEVPADLPLPAADESSVLVQDVDMGLPELHTDATDISDLQEHFESLDPEMQKEFLETFMKESNEQELPENATDNIEGLPTDMEVSTSQNEASQEHQPEEQPNQETPAEPAAVQDITDGAGDENNILDFLQAAGINPEDLNEEQLQKFINAVSGDGDIEAVIAEILMQQEEASGAVQAEQMQTEAQEPQEEQLPNEIQQPIDLTNDNEMAIDQMDDDEDGMYGDGEGDYDEDDLDLTPDIMRLILQNSNYSSILKQQTMEGYTGEGVIGDAHVAMPKPTTPTVPTARDATIPRRQSYTTTMQQQQPPFAYGTGYGYGYGYQRRDPVEILPPGYTAYNRPPSQQIQQPRYPDLSHLIKPLAYMPRKPTSIAASTDASTPKAVDAEVTKEANANGSNDDKQEKTKKNGTAGWAEIFKFQIPIPTFLGSSGAGASRNGTSDQRSEEKERNVRAMGFPPMIAGLGL